MFTTPLYIVQTRRPELNSQKLLFSLLRLTLSPSLVLKLWKMRWGKASDIVPTLGMSCLITVLEREKEAVGPYGRWHTTRPSKRKKVGGVSEEEGEKGGEEKRGFDRWLQANGKFLIIVLISYVDKRQGYRCLVMLHCLFWGLVLSLHVLSEEL